MVPLQLARGCARQVQPCGTTWLWGEGQFSGWRFVTWVRLAGLGDLGSYAERSTAGWTRPGFGEAGSLWLYTVKRPPGTCDTQPRAARLILAPSTGEMTLPMWSDLAQGLD